MPSSVTCCQTVFCDYYFLVGGATHQFSRFTQRAVIRSVLVPHGTFEECKDKATKGDERRPPNKLRNMAKRRSRKKEQNNSTTQAHPAQQQQVAAVAAAMSGGEQQRLRVSIETNETITDAVLVPKAFPQDVMVVSTAQNEHAVALQKMWTSVESKRGSTWTPTSIQLQSWSILLQSTLHLIGIAPTGSGKTLAFGLAIVASSTGGKGICGICLVPTRELAMQVEKDLKVPCRALKIQIASIYGGRVDRDDQIQILHKARHHPMVVAATPGRLVDLLEERSDLRKLCADVKFLVMDEADRLAGDIDMCQQIDKIRGMLPTNVRTCLFSATKKKSVSKKWNEWVDKPRVVIKVDTLTFGGKKEASTTSETESSDTRNASQTEDATPGAKKRRLEGGAVDVARIPAHVTQTLHVCSGDAKTKELMSTIAKIRQTQAKQRNKSLCIVFFARIKTLQSVLKLLVKEGIQGCSEYHGQKRQVQREQTLADFRSGKSTILLSTDISARGIHINNLEYVINYDFPESLDQYVHRCGRAGRTQKNGKHVSGTVYSFFTRDLAPMAKDVVELLRATDSFLDPNLIKLVESTTTSAALAQKVEEPQEEEFLSA
jgi:ATP-dependent RNA helicase DDX5/DBP2